jgi:hypothetical protein
VWSEFHECLDKPTGTAHVRCKHCNKTYAHPLVIGKALTNAKAKKGTTSSMNRHLDDCTLYNKSISQDSKNRLEDFFSNETGQQKQTLSTNDVLDKVLNFFISGNIAFNQADNPAFQELISSIKVNNQAVTINRKSVREQLDYHAKKAQEDLMSQLMTNDSKVSLALDCWTSKNNYAFLGMTVVAHISLLPSIQ